MLRRYLARAHIRDLYHVRQWAFPIVPDTLAAAREEIREVFDQGALLMARYRRVINAAELESIEEEKNRLLIRLDRLGEPDEEAS
jgi:hypothetical protein